MYRVGVLKQTRIPIQIENVKEIQYRIVVNPKDTVIDLCRQHRIVAKQMLQFRCPVNCVQFRIVSLPS